MNELDRDFRRALKFYDQHEKRWKWKTAMNPLPSWRQCPKCGAVEIYTGKPHFDPETVFVTFRQIDWLADTDLPTKLECPRCAHIVEMR